MSILIAGCNSGKPSCCLQSDSASLALTKGTSKGSLTCSAFVTVAKVAEAEFGQHTNNEPLIFFRKYWN